MALSNTERQQNYRARIKQKLAQASTAGSADIDAFRRQCEAEVQHPDYGMDDFLLDAMTGRNDVSDITGPFLAKAMGLPPDPWPGLTGNDLVQMTKGRLREAKARGLDRVPAIGSELPFVWKLRTAKHREWLEQG